MPERDFRVKSAREVARQSDNLGVGEGSAGGGQQIQLRFHAGQLGRFEEAVEQRRHLGAALGPGAVMIFAPEDDTAQAAFGAVVVERHPRVLEEQRQSLPQTQHVGDRPPEPALRQRPLRHRPVLDRPDKRTGAFLAQAPTQGQGLRLDGRVRQPRSRNVPLDGVELPDEIQHRPTGIGEVRLRLDVLSSHVRPAVSQGERRTRPGQRLIGAVAVGQNNAAVAIQDLAGRFLRAARERLIDDRVLPGHAPHPPALRSLFLHQPPPGLVGADHLGLENVPTQSVVGGPQHPGQDVELVPQRLRVDDQSLTPHDARLTLQRQVVEVFVHRHLDCERRRVPRAGLELEGAGSGVDAAVAGAAVLLALVLQDREAALHDRDLFRVLGLAVHLDELAAALWADLVGLVELVDDVEDRERRLHPGPVAAPWGGARSRSVRVGAGSLLGLVAEDHALALRQQFLESLELALDRGGVLALQVIDLGGQLLQSLVQVPVLAIEQHRHLAEDLHILYVLDPHHTCSRSWGDLEIKIFPRFSTEKWCRTERHATHERAALEKQLQLVERELQSRLALVAPQAGEPSLLQPLGVDAQPGAVPQEHFRSLARARHEDEQVARQRIALQTLGHQSAQAIEALAQIDGTAERIDGDLARAADHARTRSSATRPAAPRPSTRNPWGVIRTGRSTAATGVVATATRRSLGRVGVWSQSRNARGRTPSSRATAATATPAARRFRAIPTARRRRAGEYRIAVPVRWPR